jgi:predicted TIM-barrel fold metal-dependent hydrolase
MPPANPKVELEKIRLLDISEEARERILYRNSAELLGIDPAGIETEAGDA